MTSQGLPGTVLAVSEPWWYEYPGDPVRSDFRNFLFLVWEHLGLPAPTHAQYEIAYFLQHGWPGYATDPDSGQVVHYFGNQDAEPTYLERLAPPMDRQGRTDILEAFRGIGKSYVTAAFCLWRLLRDPRDTKILVCSASGSKAQEFVAQVKTILSTMDILAHLRPREDQRNKIDRFDVNGASMSQSYSLKAAGITGQITGSRASIIIADDIEVPDNSATEESRMKLLNKLQDFEAIKMPGGSEIIFLGTPQTEESIYTRLIKERGYRCYCWPARYPKPEKRGSYRIKREDGSLLDILAPYVARVDAEPSLEYQATDPERFDDYELAGREARGRAFFALQYMLDTSLSDAERYPLKQHDLIVMSCNAMKAPVTVQWGHATDMKNRKTDIPNVGFSGDYFLGPMFVDPEWRPYEQSVLFVDPSGRGKDETAWAVVKTLNGMLYVVHVDGFAGDPATAMRKIAHDAKLHQVNEILVEPNYAGAVWIAGFNPILAEVWPNGCSVNEAEWSRAQKEARIIDTLEPIMTLHRLVVDERVARDPTLMYQLTHLTRDRGSLQHDDRVDALAGAVARFTSTLMLDVKDAAKAQREAELDAELEDFIESCTISEVYGYRYRHHERGWERHEL